MPTIDEWLQARRNDKSIPGGMTDAQRMPAPATASNAPATPYSVPQSPKPAATPMPMAYSNSANAINTPTMPAQGYYGGADYNNSDWATKQSIQDNDSRLASDSTFRDSEYARTQGVMSGLMKSGGNVTDQQNYLAKIKGMMPQQQPAVTTVQTPSGGVMPQSSGDAVTNVRNSSDLQQQSGDKLAIERAALKTAIEAKVGSLKNNAEYQSKLLGDQRVLENASFQRNNNPFSGRTDYAAAMLGRGRQIDDTQRFGELNNQLNATQQELTNFDTLAPERQRQIYNEMLTLERNFGLQQGSLTGNYAGGRTLAAQGQDASFTGMYNGQQTLQAQNQAFNQAMASKDANWNAYKDAVGMTGNLGSGPKSDWGQLPGQQGPASYQSVQDALKNGMSQQQIDNSAKQFAEQMGYNYANMNANDKQAWAQIAISQQNAATSSSNASWARDPNNPDNIYKNAQIDQLKNPQPKTTGNYNLDDYKGYINQNFYKEQPVPGGSFGQTQKVLDTTSARNYIIGLGLPDDQTDQILKLYGLPTN